MSRGRNLLASLCLGVTLTCPAAQASDSGTQLPPAAYKPLPVGTMLDYRTWTCRVTATDGYETVCAGRGREEVTIIGKLIPVGGSTPQGYGGMFREINCSGAGGVSGFVEIEGFDVDKKSRNQIAGLWPLKVSKSAKIDLKLGRAFLPVDVRIEVTGYKEVAVAGKRHHAYEIVARSERISCPQEMDGGPINDDSGGFVQTWWYSPALNVIVASERRWELMNTESFELWKIDLP